MKVLKIMALGLAVVPTLYSCLGDGNSQNGFVLHNEPSTAYANTPKTALAFTAYGAWKMTVDGSWVTPALTSGNGMTIYNIPLTLTANTTHAMRTSRLTLQDTSDEANLAINLSQYGTRGDGSWGDAALVKEINGSDDSKITFSYDSASRPTSVTITKGEKTLHNLSFSWGDSLVTVSGDDSYSVAYQSGFQLSSVECSTDTLAYVYSYDTYSLDYVGQLGQALSTGEWSRYLALYKGQLGSFGRTTSADWPDKERKADSIKYDRHYADGSVLKEYMAVTASAVDNRCQSIDANQLLLGIDNCNPYLLLGLYRNLRSTSVIAEATTSTTKRTMTTTLNSNKSIATLTVADDKGGSVTYNFSY